MSIAYAKGKGSQEATSADSARGHKRSREDIDKANAGASSGSGADARTGPVSAELSVGDAVGDGSDSAAASTTDLMEETRATKKPRTEAISAVSIRAETGVSTASDAPPNRVLFANGLGEGASTDSLGTVFG